MRRIVTSSLRGLLAAFGIVCVVATAKAQPGPLPFDPTHYWTYHILDPLYLPSPIGAQDQFFKQGVNVTVDSLTRLLNWVHKNNSAVPDTFVHYTWWNIKEKLPVNRSVIVSNQFGSFPVQVFNLEFLLAPAWKNLQFPYPPVKNHYLCYRAFGFPPPPGGFDLRDEWRVDFQHPQQMEFLCNPCAKLHQGLIYPVVDTVTHLAVYPILPKSEVFYPFISDQFAHFPHLVQQIPIEYLFVPSEKTDRETAVKRDTWGRLKQLYR